MDGFAQGWGEATGWRLARPAHEAPGNTNAHEDLTRKAHEERGRDRSMRTLWQPLATLLSRRERPPRPAPNSRYVYAGESRPLAPRERGGGGGPNGSLASRPEEGKIYQSDSAGTHRRTKKRRCLECECVGMSWC